jgi:hypothetical protein|tara:strand:+ start:2126 stop:2494 length:369 start_codon:yes stop_codon:yes gene_type:complete
MLFKDQPKIQKSKVYLIQDIPVDKETGKPKYNVLGAQKFGEIVTLLPVYSQIILSPGPLVIKLRTLLKNFTTNDYLLLSGDPAIIGVVCSLVSDQTNGRFKLLKWDRQEKTYYPIEINIFQK